MKRLSIFLCLITLAVVFMGHKVLAQTSFSIPPKSYPVNIPFKCDAGVDRYWHVTSIICTGQANGGYKFQIKGMAQKTSRSQPIDLFYLMPGNRIKTAGTYYFPRIEEGKPFSFEVVSAFSGYAPAQFNGFFISSEVLQRLLQQELREPKEAGKNASERRFGMPKKNHSRSLYSQKSALTKYIRVVRWTRNLNIPVEPGLYSPILPEVSAILWCANSKRFKATCLFLL